MDETVLKWALNEGPVIAVIFVLWWLERKERLKLEEKLEACLEARIKEAEDDPLAA